MVQFAKVKRMERSHLRFMRGCISMCRSYTYLAPADMDTFSSQTLPPHIHISTSPSRHTMTQHAPLLAGLSTSANPTHDICTFYWVLFCTCQNLTTSLLSKPSLPHKRSAYMTPSHHVPHSRTFRKTGILTLRYSTTPCPNIILYFASRLRP